LEPKNLVFHRNAIFWFTNGEKQDRAACTLGFATHSSYYYYYMLQKYKLILLLFEDIIIIFILYISRS